MTRPPAIVQVTSASGSDSGFWRMFVDRQVTSAALPGSRLPVSVSSKAHHALDSVYIRTALGTVIAHSGLTTPAARVIRVTEL